MIAKACMLHNRQNPSILDATAGFAQDAFLLASLGANVHMLERSPILALLIEQALECVSDRDPIKQRLSFSAMDSLDFLQTPCKSVDIVYLDPMYPHRKKSALNKKSMRVLRHLVGDDLDAAKLLAPSIALANHRAVVKLPKQANYLNNKKPSYSLTGSSIRYDIYNKH